MNWMKPEPIGPLMVLWMSLLMATPTAAQGEPALRDIGRVWFTSGVRGRFADPVCEPGRQLIPSDFASYAEAVATGMADDSPAFLVDTGGLLAPHGVSRFSANHDPAALAQLVSALGYRALAFGEGDLGMGQETLLPVYQALGAAGVPVVASNLSCDGAAQALCSSLVGPEDPIPMFELGEDRVAFLAFVSPSALARVSPSAASGLSLSPTTEAMAAGVAAAREGGASVVIVSLDEGWGSEATSRVMDAVNSLEPMEKPDLVFAAGAGEQLVFARPMDFRPAIVAASPGRATQVVIRRDVARGHLDVLALPVERAASPSGEVARWIDAVGPAYCAAWGRPLPGGRLTSPMDADGILELSAGIIRDETRSEVVLLNRGLVDRSWRVADEAGLTESDVYLSLVYDEPLVTAMVEGTYLERLGREHDPERLLALGLAVTRTATATTVKVNGRPIESRGSYRVTTLRFLAAGGDGLLSEGPEWSPAGDRTIRGVVLESLRRSAEEDPRERLLPEQSVPIWTLQIDTDFSFSASASSNPGGYADSQLQATTASNFGFDTAVRLDLLQRLWGWDNLAQLRYRTTSTTGSGFEESQDLTSLRTSARWRGLRVAHPEFYIPEPYFEGFLETELTVPEQNEYRHFLVRPTLGLQFGITRHLTLKLNVGLEVEAFDADAPLGPGLGALVQLKPWVVMREGKRRLDLNFSVDYFVADVGGLNRQTLRGQLETSLAFNRYVSLGLNFNLYLRREGSMPLSAAADSLAFLRVSWLRRIIGP